MPDMIESNTFCSKTVYCIALPCYFYVFFEERNIKDKEFIDYGVKNIEIFKKLI